MATNTPFDKKVPECFVAGIRIRKLWGYRDLELTFTREANILIGRNATGKTSVINLLRYLLTLDVPALLDVTFQEVSITLQAIDGSAKHFLSARVGQSAVAISLDEQKFELEFPSGFRVSTPITEVDARDAERVLRRRIAGMRGIGNIDFREKLQAMVPSVWLPVNRGLGVVREEAGYYRPDREREISVGNVEDRLELLLKELQNYRFALEARLSAKYKEFEKRVLSLILFNKNYDNLESFQWESVSSEEERQQLATAFRDAGLLDADMQKRIDEHFAAQNEAVQRVQKGLSAKEGIAVTDFFIVPLVRRTKEMLNYARSIEADKKEIFAALNQYSKIVSDFLHDKRVSVTEKGILQIDYENPKAAGLTHRHLSSGEKQILILLTQALIFEGRPVVYIADEPELSLHVTWQEKLLEALSTLNPKMQLIIATHSPDIVGRRPTLDLERFLK